MAAAIELQQVSYRHILSKIELEINQGSRTAIVGAAGAGKSTLLRSLNRLIDPTAGRIFWQGKDLREIPIPVLRRQVLLVPQEVSLLGMTANEAITYPLKLRGMPPAQMQTRSQTWIEKLQIERKLLQRPEVELSLGQRQWIALARALVCEPEVLLLDEPTSALDRGLAQLLLDTLDKLARSPQATTIVMVNHQLDLVAQWCDHAVHLHKGQLVEASPTATVNWQELERSLSRVPQSKGQDNDDDWD